MDTMDNTQTIDNPVSGHSSPIQFNAVKKHPGGRPSKYCDEIVQLSRQYVDCYSEEGDAIPHYPGLAKYLRKHGHSVTTETLYQWSKDDRKREFSYIIKSLLDNQCGSLLNNGLTGAHNAQIAKLILSKHGYTDKIESDNRITVTVHRVDYKQDIGVTIQHDDRPALPGAD